VSVDLPLLLQLLLKKTQVQQARQRYCVHCSVWWMRRTIAAHPMAMATASEEAKAGVQYHSLTHVSPLQRERQIQREREHLDLQREG
jgi:hypothetical protein